MPEYRRAVRGCRWISPAEYRLWDALVDRGGRDGHRFPNLETLAADIAVSRSYAQKLARRLENLRIIARRERFDDSGRQTSNGYECVYVPIDKLAAPERGERIQSDVGLQMGVGTQLDAGESIQASAHECIQLDAPECSPKECSPSQRTTQRARETSPKTASADGVVEKYNQLVDAWPEDRRGVDLGAQLWLSLVDSGEITGENLEEIFSGLERWKASALWQKEDGRYIPAISGWLQKRAWKDFPKGTDGW